MPRQSQLRTIGDLATRHRVKTHQIQYLVQRLGLRAAERAGNYRLFDAAADAAIGEELARRAPLDGSASAGKGGGQ